MKNKYKMTYFSLALLCLICANSQLTAQEPQDLDFGFTENCGATPSGTVTVKVANSSFTEPPYQFNWEDIEGTSITAINESSENGTSQIGNLLAGEYCVTVTSGDGCTASGCGLLVEDCLEAAFTYELDTQNDNCGVNFFNQSMGEPDSFLWGFGDGNTSTEENPIHVYQQPGSYTVTLTVMVGMDEENTFTSTIDVTNCQGCQPLIINPTPPNITAPTFCDSDDGILDYRIRLSPTAFSPPEITGGTAPYTWSWSNGVSGQNAYILNNLTVGNYTLTLTDAYGCTSIFNHGIAAEFSELIAAISNLDNINNGCDGAIEIFVVVGNPPYTLALEDANNTITAQGSGEIFNFTGLCEGEYNITITDDGGCQTFLNGTIGGCPEITANDPEITSTTGCNQNAGKGKIVFTNGGIMGGVAPYSYLWSNGATSLNIGDLPAGTYTLTVTDANGCTAEFSYIVGIGIPQNGTAWSELEITDVVNDATGGCNGNGNCSGSISILYSFFGSHDFTIVLSGNGQNMTVFHEYTGPVQQLYDLTHTFEDLCSGNYTIQAYWRDCSYETTVTIDNEPAFEMVGSPNIIKPSNCSTADGSIFVNNPTGGTAPYIWIWSNGANTPNGINNLVADNYSVTVLDANGCMLEAAYDLTVPNEANQVTYTTMPPDAGICNGSVTVTGVPGMELTLNNADGNTYSATLTGNNFRFSQLCQSEYPLTVVDAAGCTNSFAFTLTGCPELTFSAVIFQQPTTCKIPDGRIRILGGPGGGTPPYSFYLINEAGVVMSPCTIGWCNLEEGNYMIILKDDNGCTAQFPYHLVSGGYANGVRT